MLRQIMKSGLVLTIWLTLFGAAYAQQVTLQGTDGKAVTAADLKDKITVLSFGATWVPLAAKELPALQKLADRYAARGVQVFWVSVNSAKTGAKNYAADADLDAFATKRGLKARVLRDPEQAAYRTYGVDALPTIVILKNGEVARKVVGFDPDQGEAYAAVMKELDALLK